MLQKKQICPKFCLNFAQMIACTRPKNRNIFAQHIVQVSPYQSVGISSDGGVILQKVFCFAAEKMFVSYCTCYSFFDTVCSTIKNCIKFAHCSLKKNLTDS